MTTPERSLPVVDLGYSLYRATVLNETGAYYNFSNIRYAAPPTGDLRFRDPAPPLPNRTQVLDGTFGNICPQFYAPWLFGAIKSLGPDANLFADPRTLLKQSEDCLFLDVISPVHIFKNAKKDQRNLAPVMVRIHGGGFFEGYKNADDPRGLLARAENRFIVVSMNYRLSAFGFLSSLEKSSANTSSSNAGLLDQRAALKWVQSYIHLFGGDRNQVTLFGESVGGGSVQFHTTAYGATKPGESGLFKQAIIQSPSAYIEDPKIKSEAANLFFQAAGVTSVDEARKMSTEVLQAAIAKVGQSASYGILQFGPSVDGDFVPDLPGRLYSEGRYYKDLNVLSAHNSDEGRFFTNQTVTTDEDYDNFIKQKLPSASSAVQSYFINQLYPPIYNGSQPYKTPLERLTLTVGDLNVNSFTYALERAYEDTGIHSYIFSVPPAIHAQDLAYTFYPEVPTTPPVVPVALDVQRYIAQFVVTGNPNLAGPFPFPAYGNKKAVLNLTTGGPKMAVEDVANHRNDYWLQGTYQPKA